MAGVKLKGSKPRWWNPLWIGVLLMTIASGVVGYFLLYVPLERTVGGVALTFLMVGFAYYIRIRPSRKMNRGLYILLGFSPWIVYALSGIGRFLTTHPGPGASLIVGFTVPYIIGVFFRLYESITWIDPKDYFLKAPGRGFSAPIYQ